MKTNIISSIASWKSTALLGLVALIATVAFSGVLSTTQTADAAKLGDIANGGNAKVSATVPSGGVATFTITGNATFDHNSATTVVCQDGAACEVGGAGVPDGTVTVQLTHSGAVGDVIIVSRGEVGTTPKTDYFVVIAADDSRPGSWTVKVDKMTFASATGSATFTATVMDSQATPQVLAAESVKFETSLGGLACSGTTDRLQNCTEATASGTGVSDATLYSSGYTGPATVTVSHATLGKKTFTVTISGAAAKISVSSEQGAIEIGGSTNLLVTVTDANGNAVAEHKFSGSTDVVAAGPNKGDQSLLRDDTHKKAVPGGVDIPPCFENPNTTATDGGTNSKGQCTMKVYAGKAGVDPDGSPLKDTADPPQDIAGTNPLTAPSASAVRGEHTVTVSLGAGKASDSVMINVGGPPASISTDAPDRVEALDEVTINVTVWDDADVPVGEVAFTAKRVSGDGLVETSMTKTKDGKASFTYTAGLAGSGAVIRITAGTLGVDQIKDSITIAVGPEPAPAPALTWSRDLVSGWNNVTWMGEDGASIADNVGDGVSSVYQYNSASQTWDAYFPGTDDVMGANQISSLETGGTYFIYSE